MREEEKKKPKVPQTGKQNKRIKKVNPQHEKEQEKLFTDSDAISPINKKINEGEFVQLDGAVINISKYILESYVEEKSTHFFPSFYNLIADLLRVSREVMKPFVKPIIVPQLIRAFIYARFPFTVQQRLYEKNPYTGYCTRDQFNYQWLTKEADLDLRGFIDDFEKEGKEILTDGGDMQAFIKHFGKKYKLSFQVDLFGWK